MIFVGVTVGLVTVVEDVSHGRQLGAVVGKQSEIVVPGLLEVGVGGKTNEVVVTGRPVSNCQQAEVVGMGYFFTLPVVCEAAKAISVVTQGRVISGVSLQGLSSVQTPPLGQTFSPGIFEPPKVIDGQSSFTREASAIPTLLI